MRISLLVAGLAIFGTTMTNAQQACFDDADCTNGAVCTNRVCTGGGGGSGGDKGKDEACSLDAECTSGLCNTSERKCWGYTGQRCFNNACSAQQHTVCQSRFCVEGDLLYGERCGDNAVCASGQCATTCAAAKTDQPCSVNGDCRSFLCLNRVCAPAKVGSPCETSRDCSSTVCQNRICVAGAPQNDGTTCAANGECTSGSCDIPADVRDRPSTCVAQSTPTNAPPTNAPPTNAPPTNAPPTNAPPTNANTPPTTAPPTLPPSAAVFPTNAPPTNAPPTNAPPTNAPPTTAPPTPSSPTEAPGPDDYWCFWFGYCSGGSTPTPPPTSPPTFPTSPPVTSPPTSTSGGGTWNFDCFYFGTNC